MVRKHQARNDVVSYTLIVEAACAAAGLDVAAALLAFETALFRRMRRLGRPTWRRPHHRLFQQLDQALDRVRAIALLGAETLRLDHDHAVLGHALAGEPGKARRRVMRQRDAACIETQLRRGRDLVDVLPAGSGGADEADLDVVLVEEEIAGDPQHGAPERAVGWCAHNSGFLLILLCREPRRRPLSRGAGSSPAPTTSDHQFADGRGGVAAAGSAAACGLRPTITVNRP